MVQQVNVPTAKPDNLNSILQTLMKEGENCHKLPSDLLACAVVQTGCQNPPHTK